MTGPRVEPPRRNRYLDALETGEQPRNRYLSAIGEDNAPYASTAPESKNVFQQGAELGGKVLGNLGHIATHPWELVTSPIKSALDATATKFRVTGEVEEKPFEKVDPDFEEMPRGLAPGVPGLRTRSLADATGRHGGTGTRVVLPGDPGAISHAEAEGRQNAGRAATLANAVFPGAAKAVGMVPASVAMGAALSPDDPLAGGITGGVVGALPGVAARTLRRPPKPQLGPDVPATLVTDASLPKPGTAADVAMRRTEPLGSLAKPVEINPKPLKLLKKEPLIETPSTIGGRGKQTVAEIERGKLQREILNEPEPQPTQIVDAQGNPIEIPKQRIQQARPNRYLQAVGEAPKPTAKRELTYTPPKSAEPVVEIDADATTFATPAESKIIKSAEKLGVPREAMKAPEDAAPVKEPPRPKYRQMSKDELFAELKKEQDLIDEYAVKNTTPTWTRFDDDIQVQLSGNTFSGGRYFKLQEYAGNRAAAIERELQKRYGISESDLIAKRMGDETPTRDPGMDDVAIDEPDTSFDFGANVEPARIEASKTRAVQKPREFLNYGRHTLDMTSEARIRNIVEQGRASGELQKTVKTFAEQDIEAREFAKKLVSDPLSLDPSKLRGLTGAQIKGVWGVVNENTKIAEAAARAIDEGTLTGQDLTDAMKLIEDTDASTNAALKTIVRETAETARSLGYLRQAAKNSTDPTLWMVRAKRIMGDRPLPDDVMVNIRRLAREATEVCAIG